MKRKDIVSHLRNLVEGDPPSRNGAPSRVGRIIRLARPGIALEGNGLAASPALPAEFSVGGLAGILAQHLPAVGRIDVRRVDGGWMRIGTGWVVSAGGAGARARILTAGHVLTYMIKPGNKVFRRLRPVPVGTDEAGALRQTRITFANAPDPNASGIDIRSVIWPHPLWDVALCELDTAIDLGGPPPALEADLAWPAGPDEPLAVLGYPLEPGFVPPGLDQHGGFATIFEGELGVRRICPGLCLAAPPDAAMPTTHVQAAQVLLRHDASTLGGNSGSPIFSLRTGKVVGLHVSGGTFVAGPDVPAEQANRGVPMPRLLAEARTREEIENTLPDAQRSGFDNSGRGTWTPAMVDPADEAALPFVGAAPGDIPLALSAAAIADRPDTRDWFYTPPMTAPKNAVLPLRGDKRIIHNQRSEPACVGCTLAAVIEAQRWRANPGAAPVSARMLYEMALTQDEWIDDRPGGTSLRAGIKGFFLSGVCSADIAPFVPGQRGWALTRRAADNARHITAGAYYRLRHRLADFQSAIQEIGAIAVSAHIHEGWVRPDGKRIHSIRFSRDRIGAHAFAVIGYDAEGFIIQNSWGSKWGGWRGVAGLAHWSYADWAENLIDAWVVRLAPEAPSGFGLTPPPELRETDNAMASPLRALPRAPRHALLGHVIHAERDGIIEIGRLGLGLATLREAVAGLCAPKGPGCPHLLIIHHDPFFGAEAVSRIAAYLTPTLLKNGIFPLHIAYGLDEIATFSARMRAEAALVTDRFGQVMDEAAVYLERRAKRTCGRLLEDFVLGAKMAAEPGGALWQAGAALCIDAARGRSLSFLSLGTGAIAATAQIEQAQRAGEPQLTRLIQVAPVMAPTARGFEHHEWPLGPDRMRSDLAPYNGDWADLVHALLGAPAAVRSAEGAPRPGNLPACCADADLMNRVVAAIKGRRPTPTLQFRSYGAA